MASMIDETKIGSGSGKKTTPSLSRAEVDAKFKSRGVSTKMVRDATGVEKLELTKIRSLLTVFEEAHERGWDVAKGPWARPPESRHYFVALL